MDGLTRLGNEKIGKLLLNFSLPVIAGMLVSSIYNVMDRIFIGNSVGTLGIAAITVGFPIMMIQSSLGMMVGIGANSLLSIKLGEGSKKDAAQIVGNTIILLSIISIIVTMIVFFLDPLLIFFGASKEVLPYARDYMRVIVLGSLFFDFGMGLNNFVRSEGKPNTAMAMLMIGTLLNCIFAPIFIFVFKWGMTGAGLGTVCAQAVSAVWVMLYFATGRSSLKVKRKSFRLNKQLVGRIFILGLPMFSMSIAQSITTVIMNKSLEHYGGDIAISAFGVFFSLFVLLFMPIMGIGMGAQPIIGFNYGANNFDRIKETLKYTIIAATIIAVTGSIILFIFPAELMSLFNAKDLEFVDLGTKVIRILSLFLPLLGFQIICSEYFQAVGKPVQSNILSLSRQVLLLPALLILPLFFKLDGVFFAMPVSDFFSIIITGIWFFWDIRHESRKTPEERITSRKMAPAPGVGHDAAEVAPETEPES